MAPLAPSLVVQSAVARGLTPITYGLAVVWFRLAMGYRIPEIRQARLRFRKAIQDWDGPLLVCANHLTLIDSMILLWAMAPGWRAWLRPSYFAWNLPEKRNFLDSFPKRLLCYIGKGIGIVRQGPREEMKHTLDQVKCLLRRGQGIMIFPEGTRSRSGKVESENFAYGVGQLIEELRQEGLSTRVLCVYLRGRAQETFGNLPRKGEEFYLDLEVMEPRSLYQGLRAARDCSSQIIARLVEMERRYFSTS